jgi:hypothetical protein
VGFGLMMWMRFVCVSFGHKSCFLVPSSGTAREHTRESPPRQFFAHFHVAHWFLC